MTASSAIELLPFQDSAESRAELVQWLTKTEAQPVSESFWADRLAHWWDENPARDEMPHRGWVLREAGRMVGFQGLIPVAYAVDGVRRGCGISSTWRVDEAYRHHGAMMLMKLRQLAREMLLVDSTPTADVQVMLQRMNWRASGEVKQYLVGPRWPHRLPAGSKLITDVAEVKKVAAPYQSAVGIERWVTPEYLRWYARSRTRQHFFSGIVNEADELTSYVFLTPLKWGGWSEVDHFNTHNTSDELLTLISRVRGAWWLKLHAFAGDTQWKRSSAWLKKTVVSPHYFTMPTSWVEKPKRTVLAEGDWGL
jgi:hypothetical protein